MGGNNRCAPRWASSLLKQSRSQSTLVNKVAQPVLMPRPCAVETRVCRYEERWHGFRMPRPVPWAFTFVATKNVGTDLGCHVLVPWRFTFVATKSVGTDLGCHGLVPWRFTLPAEAQR